MKGTTKEIRFPADLVAAIFFAILSVIALILMPTQISVGSSEVVNGRNFPQLLMGIILLCCAILIVKDVRKIIRKEPLEYTSIKLGTELRVLAILGIFLAFHIINLITDIFVIGAVVAAVGFLVFFRCKKKSYYAITVGVTVLIYVVFRFFLNVRF